MPHLTPRLILVHGLLVLLVSYAFIALGYIFDIPLAELYLESGDLDEFQKSALAYEVDVERVRKFTLVQQYTPYAGALFAVVLSFISIRKKKYPKLNVLVVLGLAIGFALTGLLNQEALRAILFAPGRLVFDSVATAYTINYLLWLGLSFWLAFSAKVVPPLASVGKV